MSFSKLAFEKLINNLLSVKVWILLLNFGLATLLCWNDKLSGGEWAAVVGGVTSTVVGLREGFKMIKVRSNDDSSNISV